MDAINGSLETGRLVWRRLVKAGGFVWTRPDGSMEVCFNAGYRPTREVADMVGRYRRELRMYVEEEHRRRSACVSRRPPAVGTSETARGWRPKARR